MKNQKKLITKGIHSKRLAKKKMVIPRAGAGVSLCASSYSATMTAGIPSYSFSSN